MWQPQDTQHPWLLCPFVICQHIEETQEKQQTCLQAKHAHVGGLALVHSSCPPPLLGIKLCFHPGGLDTDVRVTGGETETAVRLPRQSLSRAVTAAAQPSPSRGGRGAFFLLRCWAESFEFPAAGRGPQAISKLKPGQWTVALGPPSRRAWEETGGQAGPVSSLGRVTLP